MKAGISKLRLRKINKSDRDFFFRWWKDEELIALTSGRKENSDKVLSNFFSNMLDSKANRYFMIIIEKNPIGNVSLIHRNKRQFEIQIVIGEKIFWEKGIGTNAISEALRIAFYDLNYEVAWLAVRRTNLRAISAYKKSGFKIISPKKNLRRKNTSEFIEMKLDKPSVDEFYNRRRMY